MNWYEAFKRIMAAQREHDKAIARSLPGQLETLESLIDSAIEIRTRPSLSKRPRRK